MMAQNMHKHLLTHRVNKSNKTADLVPKRKDGKASAKGYVIHCLRKMGRL
jgi:hypothetical protein